MDFTRRFVKQKSPCAEGFRWFLRHHQDGSNYQHVLDSLVEAGRVSDACWLLAQFGPTNAVLRLDRIDAQAVVFAGSIETRGGIEVTSVLRAGRSIHCAGAIRAGQAVEAGGVIRAGAGIRVDDGALRAGDDIRADWRIDVHGAIQCAGDLRAAGEVDCAGALEVRGEARIAGDLRVKGDLRCGKGLRVGGMLVGDGGISAGHGIVCTASVQCGTHLDAGWGISVKDDLVAGGAIRAGESLQAGGEVRAGPGYGVFAGLCVQQQAWETSAHVRASVKPARLMSGWWAGAGASGSGGD